MDQTQYIKLETFVNIFAKYCTFFAECGNKTIFTIGHYLVKMRTFLAHRV